MALNGVVVEDGDGVTQIHNRFLISARIVLYLEGQQSLGD